jgi:hypothetical protein
VTDRNGPAHESFARENGWAERRWTGRALPGLAWAASRAWAVASKKGLRAKLKKKMKFSFYFFQKQFLKCI